MVSILQKNWIQPGSKDSDNKLSWKPAGMRYSNTIAIFGKGWAKLFTASDTEL